MCLLRFFKCNWPETPRKPSSGLRKCDYKSWVLCCLMMAPFLSKLVTSSQNASCICCPIELSHGSSICNGWDSKYCGNNARLDQNPGILHTPPHASQRLFILSPTFKADGSSTGGHTQLITNGTETSYLVR